MLDPVSTDRQSKSLGHRTPHIVRRGADGGVRERDPEHAAIGHASRAR
jgi:hypothetical protein